MEYDTIIFSEYFFAESELGCQINLVTTDLEHSVIKEYLESVAIKESSIKFIIVKEDLSHIFEINNALANNELNCFKKLNFTIIKHYYLI